VFITSPACQRHITANATEELKYDGFRALAYLEQGGCRFVSRNGNEMRGFQNLERWLGENLKVRGAILDGEICCLDEAGRPQFDQLELRSHEAHYNAFDLLWLNGKDLRTLPLVDRKQRLAKILPARPSWVIYLGHVEGRGTELFTEVRKHDLEGIVAKPKNSTYNNRTVWYKVNNRSEEAIPLRAIGWRFTKWEL
jgi:bifunctional non-homologous end joining protein LigD